MARNREVRVCIATAPISDCLFASVHQRVTQFSASTSSSSFQHWKDIERLAIVGESKWEKGMSVFCKLFISAKTQ
ncbi:MAG: STAS/SEC14 domain-containing protein [Bythopirellula sp.]